MPCAISTVPSVIGMTRMVVAQRWYGDFTRILNAIGSARPTLISVAGSASRSVVQIVGHRLSVVKKCE